MNKLWNKFVKLADKFDDLEKQISELNKKFTIHIQKGNDFTRLYGKESKKH